MKDGKNIYQLLNPQDVEEEQKNSRPRPKYSQEISVDKTTDAIN